MNNLLFTECPIHFKSNSQKIRVITEAWVALNGFCPSCGNVLEQYPNNNHCADFKCKLCNEDFELKSKENSFGNKIVDGAYHTMIEKISSDMASNFFFLAYKDNAVKDLFLTPKFFFTESIIEKRKPLSENAQRSGWIGCNILYNKLPRDGMIFYVKNGVINAPELVINQYKNISFLRNSSKDTRGWIFDIMLCIENIGAKEFTLEDLYKFEDFLKTKHSNNNFIKDKIRQQLQVLRDNGYLEFYSRGKYRLNNAL